MTMLLIQFVQDIISIYSQYKVIANKIQSCHITESLKTSVYFIFKT